MSKVLVVKFLLNCSFGVISDRTVAVDNVVEVIGINVESERYTSKF